MILFYNNLKNFVCVAVFLMTTLFVVASCSVDAYVEVSLDESQYPIEVEISGFIYDKDTNMPITGTEMDVILEVFNNKVSTSPIQIEKATIDEDDGSFTVEISAMSPYLRLTALGGRFYTSGSIDYYLLPSGKFDQDLNEYKVENQVIYLERR